MPDPSDVDRNSGSSSDSGSDPGAAVATIDPAASDRIESRDALESPRAYQPRAGWVGRIERSDIWRSMFRHPQIDTPRGRALQSFSNFFLHLYPVKIPARVLRLRFASVSSRRCSSAS